MSVSGNSPAASLPAAPDDEDMGAFIDEPLRGRQPDTAAAVGDHSDLASQSCHRLILQFRVVWWTCLCGVLLCGRPDDAPERCVAKPQPIWAVAMCSPGHSS